MSTYTDAVAKYQEVVKELPFDVRKQIGYMITDALEVGRDRPEQGLVNCGYVRYDDREKDYQAFASFANTLMMERT